MVRGGVLCQVGVLHPDGWGPGPKHVPPEDGLEESVHDLSDVRGLEALVGQEYREKVDEVGGGPQPLQDTSSVPTRGSAKRVTCLPYAWSSSGSLTHISSGSGRTGASRTSVRPPTRR